MANEPANPNYANSVTSGTDTSIVNSLTAGGAQYQTPGELVTVTVGGHNVASRAGGALYDTVAGAYVSIQNTTVGTTSCPKNGQ